MNLNLIPTVVQPCHSKQTNAGYIEKKPKDVHPSCCSPCWNSCEMVGDKSLPRFKPSALAPTTHFYRSINHFARSWTSALSCWWWEAIVEEAVTRNIFTPKHVLNRLDTNSHLRQIKLWQQHEPLGGETRESLLEHPAGSRHTACLREQGVESSPPCQLSATAR